MDKVDYLRKAFARMNNKEFENYVITQVWAGVKDLGLFPVTQQYVQLPKNKYALIDLYFPQINVAVEVDEMAHEQKTKQDEMRMENILSSIKKEENKTVTTFRVKEAHEEANGEIKKCSYEEIEKQIQEVITDIRKIASEHQPLHWEDDWEEKEYHKKIQEIAKKGHLDDTDFIGFKRIHVTNDIFGFNYSEGYLQFGRSMFELPEYPHCFLWFPHLVKNKTWENTLNEDWTEIQEKRIDGEKVNEKQEYYEKDNVRYTFARYRDVYGEISYRYIGNFHYVKKVKGPRGNYTYIYEKQKEQPNSIALKDNVIKELLMHKYTPSISSK